MRPEVSHQSSTAGQVSPRSEGHCRVWWVDDLHGDQGDAEVADFHQQPMELRLVCDGTAEACRAVAFTGQGEVIEPGGPPLVEVPARPGAGNRQVPAVRRSGS